MAVFLGLTAAILLVSGLATEFLAVAAMCHWPLGRRLPTTTLISCYPAFPRSATIGAMQENPYLAPVAAIAAVPTISRSVQAGIVATGTLAGACLGALNGAINGRVSPLYFVTILNWHDVQDVQRAAIWHGIQEGSLVAGLFSIGFAVGVAFIAPASCRYRDCLRYILSIVTGATAFWLLGGIAAMCLAATNPELYRLMFFGVPEQFGPMVCYAWVGGSICGVEWGGFALTFVGLFLLRRKAAIESDAPAHAKKRKQG